MCFYKTHTHTKVHSTITTAGKVVLSTIRPFLRGFRVTRPWWCSSIHLGATTVQKSGSRDFGRRRSCLRMGGRTGGLLAILGNYQRFMKCVQPRNGTADRFWWKGKWGFEGVNSDSISPQRGYGCKIFEIDKVIIFVSVWEWCIWYMKHHAAPLFYSEYRNLLVGTHGLANQFYTVIYWKMHF